MQKQVFKVVTKEAEGPVTREYPMKEAMSVATQLGMDMEADSDYLWFLKQALVALLPQGWKRESDPKGRIKYHNTKTNATTATHPLLYQYRIAYFRLLQYLPHRRNGPEESKLRDKQRSSDEDALIFNRLMDERKSNNPLRDLALRDSDKFYDSIIGPNATRPPHFIEELAEYQQANPSDMVEMAHTLGIGAEYRYFWVARMCLVLPLPPCFETTIDTMGQTKYINTEHNVLLEIHPSIHYLQKFVSRLRFTAAAFNSDMMFFYDKQMMPFVVDLPALASGSKGAFLTSEMHVSTGLSKSKRTVYQEERSMKTVIEDMMLLELTQQAGVNLATDLHLIGVVYAFIQKLKEEKLMENWNFRYTVEGEHYWYCITEERAYRRFPYTKNLKHYVKKRQKKYSTLLPTYQKSSTSRHPLFQQYGDYLYESASAEALLLMSSLLKNMMENNKFEMIKENIDVEEVFRGIENLDHDTVLDVLFSNPFEFPSKLIRKREKQESLNVSTDSEIFKEAGFKLEGDKVVFVLEDKHKSEFRDQASKAKSKQKARIVLRRKEKMNTVKLGPEAMLPFQVQVSRILARMKTDKAESEKNSASSESSSISSLSAEEEDVVPSLSQAIPVLGHDFHHSEVVMANPNAVSQLGGKSQGDRTPPKRLPTINLTPIKTAETGESVGTPSHRKDRQSMEGSLSGYRGEQRNSAAMQQTTPRIVEGKNVRLLEIIGLSGSSGKRSSAPDLHPPVADDPPPIPRCKPTIPTLSSDSDDFSLSQSRIEIRHREKVTEPTLDTVLSDTQLTTLDNRKSKGEEDKSWRLDPETSREVPFKDIKPETEREENRRQEYEDVHTRERTAFRQMMGKVTDEVAESYLDAMGFSLNSSHSHLSPMNVDGPGQSNAIIDPIRRLLEPVPARYRRSDRRLPALAPNLPSKTHDNRVMTSQNERKYVYDTDKTQNLKWETGQKGDFEHADVYRTTDTVGVRASQRNLLKKKRPITQSSQSLSSGLPESFVLSPSMTSPLHLPFTPSIPLSKPDFRLRVFLYYVTNIGFPMSQPQFLRSFEPKGEILPQHVVKMGKRLNLKVSSVKFASAESDLLWIALLQLTCPVPKEWGVGEIQTRMLKPFGTLPGDEYFMLMTAFNRRVRALELSRMSREAAVASLVRDSWFCLSTIRNEKYFYNFMTGDKTHFMTMPPKDDPDLSKDKRVQALKAYLSAKLGPQVPSKPQQPLSPRPQGALNLAHLLH